eukprot:COSAG01_NODE_20_length_38868_cov_34.606071_29_plen_178_part_00
MSQLRGSVDVGTELQSLMSLVSDQRRSARASQLGSGDERAAGRSNSRAAVTFGVPLPLRDHHSTRMAAPGAAENYHQNADLPPTTANQPPPLLCHASTNFASKLWRRQRWRPHLNSGPDSGGLYQVAASCFHKVRPADTASRTWSFHGTPPAAAPGWPPVRFTRELARIGDVCTMHT